ncbi:MAG: hypothetical protein LJE94_17685 [Deltaproteobacteria bacterium]|nr:hypothetical protein [Deltaproteobacteria bacterium]
MNKRTSTNDKQRRSGSERRLKFITPYVEQIYQGEEQRKNSDRRSGEERRKKPRN